MSRHQLALANQTKASNPLSSATTAPSILSAANPGQQAGNGQVGNNQNLMAAMNIQQQMSGVGGLQSQNQILQASQPQHPPNAMPMTLQQQQQQQQRRQEDLYVRRVLRQVNGRLEMTPEQTREMDQAPFPPGLLSNPAFPKNITTWGQLKHWAAANPQVCDPAKLMTMQTRQFAQKLAQGKDGGNRNLGQNAQGNGASMFPFQGPPQQQQQQPPLMNQSNPPPGQQQQHPMNMLGLRPITAQEIQMLRQRHGAQLANHTDDQIRKLVQNDKMQKARARAVREFAPQNVINQDQQQLLHQAQQNQAPAQVQNAAQAKQPNTAQPPPSRPAQPSQATPAQGPTPAKGAKSQAGKQTSKKRPRNDEPAEAQNSAAQTQQPAPQPSVPTAAPMQPNMQMPAKQAQARRQQRPPISRSQAEEAWNHLPEKIRQFYNEMQKNTPVTGPVTVSPEQKAAMAQQLTECKDMLARMDTLVQFSARLPGQEKIIRSLLAMVR